MLKLIPREPFTGKSNSGQRHKQEINMPRLQPKKDHAPDSDDRLIQHVCVDFIHYIKKGATYDVFKIGKLIYNLRRSVLGLERKRFKLLRKKKKNSNS